MSPSALKAGESQAYDVVRHTQAGEPIEVVIREVRLGVARSECARLSDDRSDHYEVRKHEPRPAPRFPRTGTLTASRLRAGREQWTQPVLREKAV